MGMYTQVFVVPRGTRDRVVKRFVSYRQGSLREYYRDEPTMFAKSVQNGGLFVPDYDEDRDVWVTTPMRWFEIVAEFRRDADAEDASTGPMYEDKCVQWLQQQYDLDLYEIVITEET